MLLVAGVVLLASCSSGPQGPVHIEPAGAEQFDFVDHFASGTINSQVAAATPTGRGVISLTWPNAREKTKSVTVLATYRYTFKDVPVAPGARLQFVAAKPYSMGDGVRAFVDVVDAGVTKRIFEAVLPIALNNVPAWKAVSLPLDAYANKRVAFVFGADALPTDARAAWAAFGEPQIDGPK